MIARRAFGLLVSIAAAMLSGGCASTGVTLESSRCEDLKEGNRLKALVLVSTIKAKGLQGKQLLYRVRLFDVNRNALRSRDGRYQTANGEVAATVSLMVLQSPQTFNDVRVSIPAQELGVPPNKLPVFAEVAVFNAEGKRLAVGWPPVPRLKIAQIMPPLAEPAPIPYWFIRRYAENRFPILNGPFASLAEAQAAAAEDSEPPVEVKSNEYLWFVPFYNQNAERKTVLVGPCSGEEDAREIISIFERTPALAATGWGAGAPVQVQVQQWMKERDVDRILSPPPAEAADSVEGEEHAQDE